MSATVIVNVKVLKRAQKKREELDKVFREWRRYNLSKLYFKTKKWCWKKISFLEWFCCHINHVTRAYFKEEDFPEEYRKYYSVYNRHGLTSVPELVEINNAQWVKDGLVEMSVGEYNTLTDVLDLPIIHPPKYTLDPYSLAFMLEGEGKVKKGSEPCSYWLDKDILVFSKCPDFVVYGGRKWKYNRRQVKAFKKLMEKESNEN